MGHIVVNRAAKAVTGVDAGDRVVVVLELDTKPRSVRVPADLRAALADDAVATAAFARMSYTHRREYVDWVKDAKRPETRSRRIASAVERIRAGEAHG